MTGLVTFIHLHTAWLYVHLWESWLFFLDLWSCVHFWSGLVLYLFLRRASVQRVWPWLTAVLVGWELMEIAALFAALHVFRPEALKDQVTDVLVGLLGGALGQRITSTAQSQLGLVRWFGRYIEFEEIWTAVTLAFTWVGSYGYVYNYDVLNSPGLNYWAFMLWCGAFILELVALRMLLSKLHTIRALVVLEALHLLGLFGGEYLGYVTYAVHEVGHPSAQALCFGLVHGTVTMHVFYLAAPNFLFGLHALARTLTARPALLVRGSRPRSLSWWLLAQKPRVARNALSAAR